MSYTCPAGHPSQAEDFCDTCGAKIDLAAQPAPEPAASAPAATPPAAPAGATCPNCQTPSTPDSLFCEACGYDFTTGAMPRGAGDPGGALGPGAPAPQAGAGGIPAATPPEWVAEVWIDPEWYAAQEAQEQMPSPGLPTVVALTTRSALIGRVSASRGIHPDVDCTTDSGVSRRHAQLTTDGTRWFVEDLGSSNGTYVGGMLKPLPEDPIPVGPKEELQEGDRVYVGAWTRIVVRRATDEERAAASG
ncbi:MAG: FHA domain-containing protein [Dermatophilaceae bacterium]